MMLEDLLNRQIHRRDTGRIIGLSGIKAAISLSLIGALFSGCGSGYKLDERAIEACGYKIVRRLNSPYVLAQMGEDDQDQVLFSTNSPIALPLSGVISEEYDSVHKIIRRAWRLAGLSDSPSDNLIAAFKELNGTGSNTVFPNMGYIAFSDIVYTTKSPCGYGLPNAK